MNGTHAAMGDNSEAKKQIRERLRREIDDCRAALLEADRKLLDLRQSEGTERSTGSREGKRPHKANTHYTSQPGEEFGQRGGKKKNVHDSGGSKRKAPSRIWDNPREQKRIKFAQDRDRRMHNIWNSCQSILRTLMKHRYGWPFLAPVDPVKLNIPDYFDIIQNPMDFGTIEKRISEGYYETPLKFRDDVRLVFSNCRTYNKPGQDVRFMGDSLEGVFEKRWDSSRIEAKLEEEKFRVAAEEEEIANTPIVSDTIPDAQALQSQLANLSRELEEIKCGKKGSTKGADADFRPTRAMSFDEKRALSVNLGNLPGEKLSRVVEIIQQGAGDINQGEDEIELDIDALDNDTLWRLDRYVKSCLKIKSGKRSRYSDQEKIGRVQSNLEGTVHELAQVESKLDGKKEEDIDIGGPATAGGDVEIEHDKNLDFSSSSSESDVSSDSDEAGGPRNDDAGEEGGDSKDSKEAGANKTHVFDANEASTSLPLASNVPGDGKSSPQNDVGPSKPLASADTGQETAVLSRKHTLTEPATLPDTAAQQSAEKEDSLEKPTVAGEGRMERLASVAAANVIEVTKEANLSGFGDGAPVPVVHHDSHHVPANGSNAP